MPKNNHKKHFVNRTHTWTCAGCNKDITTTDNQKLSNMKIRLHKKSCKERIGDEEEEFIYYKINKDKGDGFNTHNENSVFFQQKIE